MGDTLAPWLRTRERSMLRKMVAVVARPGILSMAGGLPDPALFPRTELARAFSDVLSEDARCLQYGATSPELLEQIVALVARRGITARPEQILITSGAQQGIDIAVRMFLEEEGPVLVDDCNYAGIHQAGSPRRPHWLELPSDLVEGSDPAQAREVLEDRRARGLAPAQLAYLTTDAHNPLGVSLSETRRDQWADLARDFSLPLIEDDPYGLLSLDGEFALPIKARASEWVVYLGSFSKILAPGLRVGYMIMPSELLERAGVVKECSDLETSALTQRAIAKVLQGDFLDRHLATVRATYRARRDALLAALEHHFEGRASWTQPAGGMFVWLEFSDDIDTVALLGRCVDQEGVAFLPGSAFTLPGSPAQARARRSVRLSFSSLQPEQFDQAVSAMARQI